MDTTRSQVITHLNPRPNYASLFTLTRTHLLRNNSHPCTSITHPHSSYFHPVTLQRTDTDLNEVCYSHVEQSCLPRHQRHWHPVWPPPHPCTVCRQRSPGSVGQTTHIAFMQFEKKNNLCFVTRRQRIPPTQMERNEIRKTPEIRQWLHSHDNMLLQDNTGNRLSTSLHQPLKSQLGYQAPPKPTALGPSSQTGVWNCGNQDTGMIQCCHPLRTISVVRWTVLVFLAWPCPIQDSQQVTGEHNPRIKHLFDAYHLKGMTRI